jgi:hypothetical protein
LPARFKQGGFFEVYAAKLGCIYCKIETLGSEHLQNLALFWIILLDLACGGA